MATEKTVIGLDVGTTGTKAAVCRKDGTVLGKGYREYDLRFGASGEVEQSAEDWYTAAAAAVTEAMRQANVGAESVAALSLSTQGGSMLALDRDFRPLTPVMTWMDRRAADEIAALCGALGEETLYQTSGWKPTASNDIAKILWVREHWPEAFAKTACFSTTLEYMNRRLTGKTVGDPTNEAIRILFDIRRGAYDGKILSALGIGEDRLPAVQPTGSFVGTLTAEAAKDLGLTTAVRVYNGAHDQYCASLGAGAVENGDMMVATGTAWVVLAITDRLLFSESRVSPGIHPVRGLYGAMASLVSAGSALKWYKNLIGEDYASLDAGAAARREHAADLFFAPYLAGAGFPHPDPNEPSRLIGLKLAHDRYDIALALMEGVAFEVRAVLDELRSLGCSVRRLYMAGRTAHSDLWRGLVRDICGCEILVTDEPDTCCVGAAMIAAVGAGMYPSLEKAVRGMSRLSIRDVPDAAQTAFYQTKYRRYRELLAGETAKGNTKS